MYLFILFTCVIKLTVNNSRSLVILSLFMQISHSDKDMTTPFQDYPRSYWAQCWVDRVSCFCHLFTQTLENTAFTGLWVHQNLQQFGATLNKCGCAVTGLRGYDSDVLKLRISRCRRWNVCWQCSGRHCLKQKLLFI